MGQVHSVGPRVLDRGVQQQPLNSFHPATDPNISTMWTFFAHCVNVSTSSSAAMCRAERWVWLEYSY